MQEQQRILIADDEPEIREVLRMMLGSEGYEILEAVNAQEAVEQAERVDLVILDIMMPGESGIQACTRIREKTNVPILFLTAKSGEHDKVIGFSAGGDDYLVKPFSYMELLSRVKALIRRYRVYQRTEEKTKRLIFADSWTGRLFDRDGIPDPAPPHIQSEKGFFCEGDLRDHLEGDVFSKFRQYGDGAYPKHPAEAGEERRILYTEHLGKRLLC